jgi:hypothetical protein
MRFGDDAMSVLVDESILFLRGDLRLAGPLGVMG